MDKKTVNYIKAIAEIRSISAAAESLGISQPALSAHLKKTETELGAILFDRSRQPLELTEAGQAYLNYLERTQSLEKELEQTISDIEGLETGSLTIGGAVFFNIAYIPRAVSAFAKEYPGVNIEIVDGNVPFLATEALKGRLDLFITPDADEPDRFVYEELLKERVYLAVPADWDINASFADKGNAGKGNADKGSTGNGDAKRITKDEFKKLCDCPFILLREEQNIGRMMEQLFEKYNCRPEKTIHVEQTMTSLALTMAGVGVSLITENSIRTSGLAKLPELYLADETICTRSIYVAYPRNKYLSRAAAEFINKLKEVNAAGPTKAAESGTTGSAESGAAGSAEAGTPACAFYPSIVENLARNAVKTPDKLCMADERKSITYKEAWDGICGLAMELSNRGIAKGSCVVIECNQSVDYLITVLAVQLLGAISVPLEKNAATGRIVEIASETEAALHIGAREIPELESELNIPHMDIKTVPDFALGQIKNNVYRGSIEDLELIAFPEAEDVAEILFSTGTTGKSKGIVLSHANDVALAENVCCGVKMKPDNVELVPMPTSHSHGLRRTYANLANGSSVVFADNIMLLKNVFKQMDKYHVTAMDLSPSILNIFFKLSKDRLGDYADVLDYIQLGSAPLSEEDKAHLSRILPKTRLYNFYGSTEAGCSCLMDFNDDSSGVFGNTQRAPGCIGRPAVNAEFIVVDENRNPIESSRDNLGFLASRGAINMKEYFKAPELTAKATDGEYIYTKDLGYIDEDGYVYMLGRKDDVINFGGVKISPEEIESQVIKHDAVRDCACIPMDDAVTGQAPKLFIALEDGAEYDAKAFKSFLTEVLDANKQPKVVEVIDQIPRTFNGKIKRNELMEQ